MTQDNNLLAVCSTKLNEVQQKHLIVEKELLAIDKCCQVFRNMIKVAVIKACRDHMSLTHGPATKHTSQRVTRQMIRINQDCNIKQFKHVDIDKNTGGDGVTRIPMREDINDNEVFMKIKQHTFKYAFLLDMNYAQQEQLKDRELKSCRPSSSSNNFGTKSHNNIKLSTHKGKIYVLKSYRISLSSWCHENLQHRGETCMSKTIDINLSWSKIAHCARNTKQ